VLLCVFKFEENDMSEVDWSKAPSWATKLMERTTDKGVYIWADSIEYRYTNNSRIHKFSDTTVVFKLVEMRPNKWQEGEERVNNIGPSGNDNWKDGLVTDNP
jgi:hypothetical protein